MTAGQIYGIFLLLADFCFLAGFLSLPSVRFRMFFKVWPKKATMDDVQRTYERNLSDRFSKKEALRLLKLLRPDLYYCWGGRN